VHDPKPSDPPPGYITSILENLRGSHGDQAVVGVRVVVLAASTVRQIVTPGVPQYNARNNTFRVSPDRHHCVRVAKNKGIIGGGTPRVFLFLPLNPGEAHGHGLALAPAGVNVFGHGRCIAITAERLLAGRRGTKRPIHFVARTSFDRPITVGALAVMGEGLFGQCQGRRDSVDEDEAIEIATDYLDEIGWFSDGPIEPDHVVRV
jgi:hypothetical protein